MALSAKRMADDVTVPAISSDEFFIFLCMPTENARHIKALLLQMMRQHPATCTAGLGRPLLCDLGHRFPSTWRMAARPICAAGIEM